MPVKGSIQGIYGGLAWISGDDVALKFTDGTIKAVDKGAVKACVEEQNLINVQGMTIRSDQNVTHVYFGELSLTFSNDELFSMLR